LRYPLRIAYLCYAIGLALAAAASAWTDRWLVAAALTICILHLLYNAEPIRLGEIGLVVVPLVSL
jgi:hypothetical protein